MSEFDNLPRDGSSAPIPVGTRVQYVDASDTPKISPINISTAWTELIPPEGAAQVELTCADAIFRVAADDGGDDGYELVAIGFQKIVHCGKGNPIYVYGEAAGSLSTAWVMVKG